MAIENQDPSLVIELRSASLLPYTFLGHFRDLVKLLALCMVLQTPIIAPCSNLMVQKGWQLAGPFHLPRRSAWSFPLPPFLFLFARKLSKTRILLQK